MKRSTCLRAAFFTLAAGSASFAQDQAPPLSHAQIPQRYQQQPELPEPEKLLSVEFPGGTIGQYVDALRKSSPGGSANIVVSERASRIPISAIKLKDVTLEVAVYAIPAAYSGAPGMWHVGDVLPPNSTRINGMFPGQFFDGRNTTFQVDFETRADFNSVDSQVESFSLARLLNPGGAAKPNENAAVVLTAIDTGLRLLTEEADRQPELKFHPDSSLLFVRGTSIQVKLVGSVVARMTDEATRLQGVTERRARAEQLRKLMVKEAELDVEFKDIELNAAATESHEKEKQFESGAISAPEMARARLDAARARMSLERAKLALERAKLGAPEGAGNEPAAAEEPGANVVAPATQPEAPKLPTPHPANTKRPGR